jgi:hypothetical protein
MSINLFRKLFTKPVTLAANIEAVKPGMQVAPKAGTQIMLVEVVATGERIQVKDCDAIQVLVAAGQIKPVVKKPYVAPLTSAKWTVQEEYATGDYFICWQCPTCGAGGRFPGAKPEAAHLLRAWHCGHPNGEAVPQAIVDKYVTLNRPAAPLGYPEQNSCPGNIQQALDLKWRAERAGKPR